MCISYLKNLLPKTFQPSNDRRTTLKTSTGSRVLTSHHDLIAIVVVASVDNLMTFIAPYRVPDIVVSTYTELPSQHNAYLNDLIRQIEGALRFAQSCRSLMLVGQSQQSQYSFSSTRKKQTFAVVTKLV